MSTLVSLAPEPFHDIIHMIDTRSVIKLWICGNKMINMKLSSPMGVQKIDIEPGQKSIAPPPSLVSQFSGLKDFSAATLDQDARHWISGDYLSTLSQNLQSLSLYILGDVLVAKDFFTTNPSAFPNLTTLYLSCRQEMSDFDFKLPPNLTNMRFGDFARPLASLSIASLPPGLTELYCGTHNIVVPEDGSGFPQRLRILEIYCKSPFPPVFHLIPKSCTSLSYKGAMSTMKDEDWDVIGQIALESLDLSISPPLEVKHMLSLPQTLHTLGFIGYGLSMSPEECIPLLKSVPQSVTALSGLFPHQITSEIARALPRSLKGSIDRFINADAVDWLPSKISIVDLTKTTDFHLIHAFPPFLEVLRISELPPSVAKLLPSTLSEVEVHGWDAIITEEAIKALPPNLRSFYIEGGDITHVESIECLKHFPKGITSLTLVLERNWNEGFEERFVPLFLPPESSSWIPRNVADLTLGCLDFSTDNPLSSWFSELPKTLLYLDLFIDNFLVAHLQPLSSHMNLRCLQIMTARTPKDGWDRCLDFLPPLLYRLDFEDLSHPSTNITDDDFKAIPKSLEWLNLPQSPLLSPNCCAHLPNLKRLFLHDETPSWFL